MVLRILMVGATVSVLRLQGRFAASVIARMGFVRKAARRLASRQTMDVDVHMGPNSLGTCVTSVLRWKRNSVLANAKKGTLVHGVIENVFRTYRMQRHWAIWSRPTNMRATNYEQTVGRVALVLGMERAWMGTVCAMTIGLTTVLPSVPKHVRLGPLEKYALAMACVSYTAKRPPAFVRKDGAATTAPYNVPVLVPPVNRVPVTAYARYRIPKISHRQLRAVAPESLPAKLVI